MGGAGLYLLSDLRAASPASCTTSIRLQRGRHDADRRGGGIGRDAENFSARGGDRPASAMSHNTFGHLFRFTTWGESHGPAIGVVVDGTPPGIAFEPGDIQTWLDKRKPGLSRFVTQRREPDTVEILSGVFEGRTTGTPISLLIKNEDQRSKDYTKIKDQFRPGHADYTYWAGTGASATIAVAAVLGAGNGEPGRGRRHRAQILAHLLPQPVEICGALIQMGPHGIDRAKWDWAETQNNTFWCPDAATAQRWETYLDGSASRVHRPAR